MSRHWIPNPTGFHGDRHERNNQLFPQLEETPDLSRGEQRLAAEVALEQLNGRDVPGEVMSAAVRILGVMARG